jgi:hypothetical protein
MSAVKDLAGSARELSCPGQWFDVICNRLRGNIFGGHNYWF